MPFIIMSDYFKFFGIQSNDCESQFEAPLIVRNAVSQRNLHPFILFLSFSFLGAGESGKSTIVKQMK